MAGPAEPATLVVPPAPAPALEAQPVAPATPAAVASTPVHAAHVHPRPRPRRRVLAAGRHHAPELARHRARPHRHATFVLHGTLQLTATGGQAVQASDDRNSVIYFVPDSGDYRPRPERATIYTHHRDFDPDWLAVPVGSTVTFTNLDQVTHNVFSVTPGSSFDLGYQSSQKSISHRFGHGGMVLISCHVHRYMRGDILVVPSRYATRAGGDGRFVLRGLPPVPGVLYVWNPRATPVTRKLSPPFSDVHVRLQIAQPAVKTRIALGPGS